MKLHSKFILVPCLLLVTLQLSSGQDKLILTLNDSIRLALSQNPYHLASEERAEAAKSKIREAAANFFPALNSQGLYTLDEKLFELEFPSFIPGLPARKVAIDFTKDYQFSLALSVPLFAGGRLVSGHKQAKYNFLSAEEGVRQSIQQTVFNTKRAFFGYLLAQEFVMVAEEAVAVAEKHFQNVRSLSEVGMASKFDLLRSEVQVANLRPQLIKARNSLRVAELGLKTLLGVEVSTPVEIRGELKYEPVTPDLEQALAKAFESRPEIHQLRYQKQMAGEMLKMYRAEYLPTVALSGTYNFWADKLNFQKDTWQSFYTVNLVFNLPLVNGFATSSRIAQSQALIKEIVLVEKGLLDTIEFEVRQAILNLEQSRESLLSQGKNVQQAQESLRIAELNFAEGLVTTLDVSAAQAALSQAKTNYSQALFEYVVAQADLDKAMGIGLAEGKSQDE